ncbi:uncharacterized protein [Onthophagus taurus]|uniref:uncharacterized protein n=1 Tax=Onthophagus taurus TaxID=166361 RepID=UPI000C2034FD|nr:uncharacterized protein LOC111427390 [Onthophagus taurus]
MTCFKKMSYYVIVHQKIFLLTLNIICKILGIMLIFSYIKSPTFILLPIGCLMFIIPYFGCAGSFFENRIILIGYGAVQLSFFTAQLILLLLYLFGKFSYAHKSLTKVDQDLETFSCFEWFILAISAILEFVGGSFSIYISNKLELLNINYNNFENDNDDVKIIEFESENISL